MREIFFRGKPIHKEDYMLYKKIKYSVGYCKDGFVYGSLIVKNDKYFICVGVAGVLLNSLVNNATVTLIEVIPETVGQYTGLTDKNGKKIFEGDILREAYHPEQDVIIEWSDGSFGFRRVNKPKDCVYSNVRYMQNAMSRLKIIGNIYDNDNPELLEVEE